MDCSLPGPSIHGILQARILQWVAISFSRGSSYPGIEPWSSALQVDSLLTELGGKAMGLISILVRGGRGELQGKQMTARNRAEEEGEREVKKSKWLFRKINGPLGE